MKCLALTYSAVLFALGGLVHLQQLFAYRPGSARVPGATITGFFNTKLLSNSLGLFPCSVAVFALLPWLLGLAHSLPTAVPVIGSLPVPTYGSTSHPMPTAGLHQLRGQAHYLTLRRMAAVGTSGRSEWRELLSQSIKDVARLCKKFNLDFGLCIEIQHNSHFS